MEQKPKALVAMSGGVDSSVAALLTKEAGYDCIGVTMKLYDNEDAGITDTKTCCSADDVADARAVCARLGIPFYVFNFKSDFKEKVIDRFICAYECGATPNPCIDCNRFLKFDRLYKRAKELDCDCIVTGHYARIEERNGRFLLKKAADLKKDQSYVLYSLTSEQLAHTRFPLGEIENKDKARSVALENGFVNAKKHDSQDICFVPDGDYARVIELNTGKKYPEGNFVTKDGKVLGKHKGIIRYTIGQRRGLGLALPEPMYVCEKRIDTNEVVLCTDKELFSREFTADDFNWIMFEDPPAKFRAKVKIRYSQTEQPAEIEPLADGRVKVVFDEPQRAIAKGQAAVIYDGDIVVGGGTIIQ